MGLLSWLFPSAKDRLDKAKKLIGDERFAEARMELMKVSDDVPEELMTETQSLKAECERSLVKVNLAKAIQRKRGGENSAVEGHLDVANRLHDGSLEALFEETYQTLAAIEESQRVESVWRGLRDFALTREQLGTDPGDFTRIAYQGTGAVRLLFAGGRPFNLPGLEFEPFAEWYAPVWATEIAEVSPSDGIARLRAQYPDNFGAHFASLDASVVQAVGQVARERPEQAVQALIQQEMTNPVIAYELGRAASGLGQHEAALLAFEAAEAAADGSFSVGGISTATWRGACAFWSEDFRRAARASADIPSGESLGLVAVIQIETGNIDEARAALETISEDDDRYPQLAGVVRLKESLAAAFQEHPVLGEEEARGSDEWNAALEATVARLQTELDDVVSDLKDEDADEFDDELDDSLEDSLSDSVDDSLDESVTESPEDAPSDSGDDESKD